MTDLDHAREFVNMQYGSEEAYQAHWHVQRLKRGGAYKLVLKDYDGTLAKAEQRLQKYR